MINRVSYSPLKPEILKSPSSKARSVGFGCRVMAFTTSSGYLNPELVQEFLAGEGALSLKEQSGPYTTTRNGIDIPFDTEDLLQLDTKGNPDGWGIRAYTAQGGTYARSRDSAGDDSGFDREVGKVIKQNSDIVLSHIRLDPSSRYNITTVNEEPSNENDMPAVDIRVENAHPFVYENWSFMHNGLFNKSVLASADTSHEITGQPEGSTDSELFFFHFLKKLRRTCNDEKPPVEVTKKIFAQAINDVIKKSKNSSFELNGEVMGIRGHLNSPSKLNFILSDGENLFVFRKYQNLYLGENSAPDGKKEYIIASEYSQPKNGEVKWIKIPDEHILTLAKNEEGRRVPVLTPLWQALMEPIEKS